MTEQEIFDRYMKRYEFFGIELTENQKKAVRESLEFQKYKAAVLLCCSRGMCFQEAAEVIQKMWMELETKMQHTIKPIVDAINNLKETDNMCSIEIKKKLKHEKNPMRIKQLNIKLNEALKREKRKKTC